MFTGDKQAPTRTNFKNTNTNHKSKLIAQCLQKTKNNKKQILEKLRQENDWQDERENDEEILKRWMEKMVQQYEGEFEGTLNEEERSTLINDMIEEMYTEEGTF